MKTNSYCTHFFTLSLLVLFTLNSCAKEQAEPDFMNLENLPKDTGGIHKGFYLNSTIPLGYYIYTPSGYTQNNAIYPLLVFLHGSGEKGNSMNDTSVLKKVLVNGPPKLIKYKKWNPRHPMIVVSPQCHDGGWDANKIHQLIDLLVKNYRINTHRIYLTGLSMGGYGTFSYIQTFADTGFVAAAVPIAGGGSTSKASKFKNMPLWAFHGDADGTVAASNSINMVKAINDLNPNIQAKLTIYPGVGHDSWSKTYDGTGMGTESKDYDPFDMSIYDWLFKYTK